MKKISLLMASLLISMTWLFSQEKNDSIHMKATNNPTGHPLVLVNGFETDMESLVLSPTHIEAINILKDKPAIDQYGKKAREGVVLITTKPAIEFYKLTDFVDASKNLNSSVTKIELNGKLLADAHKLLIEKAALVNSMISADWKLDANCNLTSADTLVITTQFRENRK